MRRHPIANAQHRRCRWGFHKYGEVHDGPLLVNGKALPAHTCLECGLTAILGILYAGTAVQWTTTFATPPSNTLTTPSTVAYSYRVGGAAATTWTYPVGGGEITLVSTGVLTAAVDTTSLAGNWVLQATGTGACAAVSVTALAVSAPPL